MKRVHFVVILSVIAVAMAWATVCDDPHYQWCPEVNLTLVGDDAWTCCDLVNLCPSGDPKRYSVTADKYTWSDQYGGPYTCVKDPSAPNYSNPGTCCSPPG